MARSNEEKTLSFEELLGGVWRRRRTALAVTGSVLALGLLWVVATPAKYAASTVVRVDLQPPSEEYVAPTVTELVQDRMATVRYELLSFPVLSQVIEELDLHPRLRERSGMSAAVHAMRSAIEVKVEGENAFLVTVHASDPELAARIANRIPEIYAEQAWTERAEAAERAAAIFDAELERVRPLVESFERQLAAFKTEHAGRLPETLESNLRQLDRLSGLTEAALTSLADAQRRRTALARVGAESSVEVRRHARAVDEVRRELHGLQAIYTDDHPEVVALRRALEEAKARHDAAVAEASGGDSEQKRLDAEIAWLRKTAADYQRRIDRIMERVEATPAVGARLAAIHRDYDAVREKYQTLLSRKVEAELALNLERRRKASLFHVVEPAFAAPAPAQPDPVSALGISLLVGLGLGIAAATYRASRDTAIRGAADARDRLGLPVLAVVPRIPAGRSPA